MPDSKIDDGGAAFAMPASEHSQGGHFEQRGLSKRDYFAAAALKAVIQTCNLDNKQAGESDEHMFARKALACADALIAASKSEVDHG